MTLDEAIEVLTKDQKDHHSFPTDIIGKAEKLGIEALTRVKLQRDPAGVITPRLLLSETED